MAGTEYEIITVELKPNQRLGVVILDKLERHTNLVIEVRSTPEPTEAPGAFGIEVYEHSPESCILGCKPIYEVLSIPPEDQPAYTEIMRQRAAERRASVPDGFIQLDEALRKAIRKVPKG